MTRTPLFHREKTERTHWAPELAYKSLYTLAFVLLCSKAERTTLLKEYFRIPDFISTCRTRRPKAKSEQLNTSSVEKQNPCWLKKWLFSENGFLLCGKYTSFVSQFSLWNSSKKFVYIVLINGWIKYRENWLAGFIWSVLANQIQFSYKWS